MNADTNIPVVIAGGGLVGLAMASFLGHHGIRCQVIERRAELSGQPRSRGINPRTMELMRELGLEDVIRATASAQALQRNAGVIAMHSLAGPEIGALTERYVTDLDADLQHLTPTTWCQCHQAELEPVLAAHAARLGAQLRFATAVTDVVQDSDAVQITVCEQATGESTTIRARYLIAADGAASTIREQLGIALEGAGTLGQFMNIHFRADLREQLGARRFVMAYTFQPRRTGLMPLDNAHEWLLHAMFDPTEEPAQSFDEDRCTAIVRQVVGLDDLAVKVLDARAWTSAAGVAARFRAGRVFLVGDAAHVMPPTGAFGSNTGIQDAHNLAWKLAAVLRGQAEDRLLDSYDIERWAAATATVHQSTLRSKDRPRMAHESPLPPNPEIVPDQLVWFGPRQCAVLAETMATHAEWPAQLDGSPGTRTPHVPILRDDREVSTVDLLGSGFVLFAGSAGEAWTTAADKVAATLATSVQGYCAGVDFEDHTGAFESALGIGTHGAVLVRPDGLVAWRTTEPANDPAATLIGVLGELLGRGDLAQLRVPLK